MSQPSLDPTGLSRRDFLGNAARLGVAAGLLGTPLLAACGSGSSKGSTGTSGKSGKSGTSGGDLSMGWIRPTTGLLSKSFAPLYIGGLIAIDEINAAGGILGRQIKRDEVDDAGSPANEPSAVRKLTSDGVNFACGPTGSSQVLASLAVTSPAKVIQTGFADDTPMGDGTKYPYHYQFVFNTDQEAEACVGYLVKSAGAKKVGFLSENTAFGQGAMEASDRVLKKLGAKKGPVQTFPITTTDFTPYVSKLKDAGCDGVVAWIANIPNAIQAFTALNSLGWFPPVTGHNGLLYGPLVDAVPAKVVEKVYAIHYRTLSWSGNNVPGDRQQALAKKINNQPDAKGLGAVIAGAPFYDFLHLLKQVIEQEKSFDTDKVKKALDSVSGYDGILGSMSFTESKHTALSQDAMVMVKVSSVKDPKSNNCFREMAPGQ